MEMAPTNSSALSMGTSTKVWMPATSTGDSQGMAVEIGLIFSQIGDLKRLLGFGNAAHGSCAAHCGALPLLHVGRLQRAVKCSVAEAMSFPEPHGAVAGLAEPCRVCQYCLEHRLQFAR